MPGTDDAPQAVTDPAVDDGRDEATPDAHLPFAFARRNGVMLRFDADGGVSALARHDVELSALMEAQRHAGRLLRFERLDDAGFEALLQETYEQRNGAAEAMENLDDELDLDHVIETLPEPEDLLDREDDAPIVRLINALLGQAINAGASDIHIEPYENRVVVRMRVDGMLREVLQPKRGIAPLVVSRIKVMSRLDIAEKRLPQDGRMALRIAGRAVDVRVSTLPSNHGERVVLRLLDKQAGRLNLSHLGMAPGMLDRLRDLISHPHGILLVTGPTGSGKTTSLYAMLTELNEQHRNIMTVEDPIEYDLDGIAQTQVNGKVELSFARGLRAILRQDPDVVMVGEIRDAETANIAVQASLTGHLVLSTLHTNSAVGAVTRLRDMGVQPFLLSSSLIGVIAQRLARRLCPDCSRAVAVDDAEREVLGLSPEVTEVREPVGCPECRGTGYRGRIGVYDLLEIDATVRPLIHERASESEILAAAGRDRDGLTLAAARLVADGITSVAEATRVTRDN